MKQNKKNVMSHLESMKEEIHIASIAIATIIASAYKISDRTPQEAQDAIFNYFKNIDPNKWLLTVGDLDLVTAW